MNSAAILLAGGSGTRMGGTDNKVYLLLDGRSLVAWSLSTFADSGLFERLVLVVREDDRPRAGRIIAEHGHRTTIDVVAGGATRHDSEWAGLAHLAPAIERGDIDVVAVHDTARPFVTQQLLHEVVRTARRSGGAVPGLPPNEHYFLKVAKGAPPAPVPTPGLRLVQTPQAFDAAALLSAYRRAAEHDFHGTDTADSVQRFTDLPIEVVPGDQRNLKITYVDDLVRAEALVGDFRTC